MTVPAQRRTSARRVGNTPTSAAASRDTGIVLREVLSAAAEATCSELALAPDIGFPLEQLRAGAAQLCAAAALTLHDATGSVHLTIPPALPVGRLMAGMRRSLLLQARSGLLPRHDTLELLDALEAVQVALESDAGHRFASRLGGTDGLSLLVDVAHDMRSPLGSILFLAEQMRRGRSGALTEVQERQLGLIYGAALGLSTLASDVMDVARGADTLVEQQAHPISIAGIFQAVRVLVQPMAEERGLTLRFESTVTDARIGHGAALQRVLLNLVTNAVKFTPTGEIIVSVTPVSPTHVRFEVRDTGRGIPEETLETLFDGFRRRLKPGQYVFSSAGLGLSICQKLVQAMGGELLVESVADAGSVFRFDVDLPRAPLS